MVENYLELPKMTQTDHFRTFWVIVCNFERFCVILSDLGRFWVHINEPTYEPDLNYQMSAYMVHKKKQENFNTI